MKKDTENQTTCWQPICMSIGVGLGMLIGSLCGQIPIGMSIGIGLGLAVGGVIDHMKKNDKREGD